MGIRLMRFKRTVTAFLFLLCSAGFSAAQESALDPLFDDLLTADDTNHDAIATEILRELERSGSAAMDLLYRRGADAGYVGPALDDLATTLRLEPRHFQALFGLGNIMETLERPEDAMEVYQAVLAIYPLEPMTLEAIERVEFLLRGQSL